MRSALRPRAAKNSANVQKYRSSRQSNAQTSKFNAPRTLSIVISFKHFRSAFVLGKSCPWMHSFCSHASFRNFKHGSPKTSAIFLHSGLSNESDILHGSFVCFAPSISFFEDDEISLSCTISFGNGIDLMRRVFIIISVDFLFSGWLCDSRRSLLLRFGLGTGLDSLESPTSRLEKAKRRSVELRSSSERMDARMYLRLPLRAGTCKLFSPIKSSMNLVSSSVAHTLKTSSSKLQTLDTPIVSTLFSLSWKSFASVANHVQMEKFSNKNLQYSDRWSLRSQLMRPRLRVDYCSCIHRPKKNDGRQLFFRWYPWRTNTHWVEEFITQANRTRFSPLVLLRNRDSKNTKQISRAIISLTDDSGAIPTPTSIFEIFGRASKAR